MTQQSRYRLEMTDDSANRDEMTNRVFTRVDGPERWIASVD